MENKKEKNVALNDDQFDNVSGGFSQGNSSLDYSACDNYDNCNSCQSFLCPHNPYNPTIDPKELYPDF